LEFHKGLNLGTLLAGRRTQTAEHPEREVMYVESGTGRIESGNNFWPLAPGYAVLIPPHVEHILVSESKEPLFLLLLTDAVESGSTPGKTILVRNSADLPYSEQAHWNYFPKFLFGTRDGLNPQSRVVLVEMYPMTIGAPHAHVPHWEEVWCKLPPDDSYAFLGSEVRKQHPNEAFLAPPNGKTVHSVANFSAHPTFWFYFGHYPAVDPPDWVYDVPSVPPQKIKK
jgi:hypothetical protein